MHKALASLPNTRKTKKKGRKTLKNMLPLDLSPSEIFSHFDGAWELAGEGTQGWVVARVPLGHWGSHLAPKEHSDLWNFCGLFSLAS